MDIYDSDYINNPSSPAGGGLPDYDDLNTLRLFADAHNKQTKLAPGLNMEPAMQTEASGADPVPVQAKPVELEKSPSNTYMKWGIIAAAIFIVTQFANLRT